MLRIVKIGGNIVDNPSKLSAFLRDFAVLEGSKILVHGGGKIATSIAKALGIETVMVDGRRVTDRETLQVVTMVYNGINKQIVSDLQSKNCDAIGLCGADAGLIVSKKRAPIQVGEKMVDYGFVGDPVKVNVDIVNKVMNSRLALVVAPITQDEKGGLLNTNADTVASALATAMVDDKQEIELIYCFECQGVMTDIDDPTSVIPQIDRARFEELRIAGIVDKGMIPKLENALTAVGKGVKRVVICAEDNLAKPGYGGTEII